MDYKDYILIMAAGFGGTGLLVGLLLLWKTGFLQYVVDLKKNGKNGNGNDEKIKELFKHADTANFEMGKIKDTLGEIRDDYRQHLAEDKDFQKEARGKTDEILKMLYEIKNK